MHVVERGRGSAVLILHGCPTAISHLEPLVEALAGEHHVLVPELPGYGSSPRLSPYSLERAETMLIDLLRAREVRRISIVGYSMGAYRAFRLALRGEIPVERIVTLGGMAGYTREHRVAFGELARRCREMNGRWDPEWCTALARNGFFGPGHLDRHPEALAPVVGWFDAVSPEVLADELEAAATAPDLYERIGTLRIPITARVGSADAATPPAYSEQIVAAVPDGRLQIVPGCGHVLLAEDRDATVRAVCQALGWRG